MRNLAYYNLYCLRISAALAAICAVAAFAYGAFLLMAVAHTANLSHAQAQVRAVAGETSQLEGEYLARQQGLTLEYALLLGFVEPNEESVVYATPASLTVNR